MRATPILTAFSQQDLAITFGGAEIFLNFYLHFPDQQSLCCLEFYHIHVEIQHILTEFTIFSDRGDLRVAMGDFRPH